MSDLQQLSLEARALPLQQRSAILSSMPETDIHGFLADLFRAMEPTYWVEVTHGSDEFGKDLVIVRKDRLAADVIAVVVKKGDIRGKTAGDVDVVKERITKADSAKGRVTREILSQIEQATAHDAVLSAYVSKLKPSKVFVVLVGTMSKQARQRLDMEVGALGRIIDLPSLVDLFTDYFPQVFFEGHAVSFIDSRLRELEHDTFFDKAGRTLSECYVEPYVSKLDNPFSLDEDSFAIHVRNKKVKLSHFSTLTVDHRRVLLVGDPGSGKSKALAKLCIDSYKETFPKLIRTSKPDATLPIPLMLPARRLLEYNDLEAFLEKELPLKVRGRFSISVLLIDGLDEVAADQRPRALDLATSFASSIDASLLITSRKLALVNNPPKGFERYELLPFEVGQALRLFQKVLADTNALPALKEGLERIKSQIPMNPLSLLLLVELVTEHKEVPSSITELYDRYLDMVLGRWDAEKGIEVLFDYVIKKRFLAALAYDEFYLKNRLEIPVDDFQHFVQRYHELYGWAPSHDDSFLRELERAGIVTLQEEIFFNHRSFLEYFVAAYIYDRRSDIADLIPLVTSIYYDLMWSESAFFYAGLLRELSPDLLLSISQYPTKTISDSIGKVLIGRLLQAAWHSSAEIKIEGLRTSVGSISMVQDEFGMLLDKAGLSWPKVYQDIFVLLLADLSFSSSFVNREVGLLFDEASANAVSSEADSFRKLALLWGMRRFLTPEELDKRTTALIDSFDSTTLGASGQARLLVLSHLLKPQDTALILSLKRRLKRVLKQAPNVAQELQAKGKARHPFRPPARLKG
jgi:hypothetical protein